jgi:MFS family permease
MGYLGVSLLAFLTGLVASSYGLRPVPFYLGVVVAVLGLLLSFTVKETHKPMSVLRLRWIKGVGLPSLLGLMTNLKDGLVWLSLPLLLSAKGFSPTEIGLVAGLYPLAWASGQLVFGPLSDRLGRQPLILVGVALQGIGLLVMANVPELFLTLLAAFLLGLGTSMAYPTLIAQVADKAPLEARASALGLYRFFRDSGYVVGAGLASLTFVSLSLLIMWTGLFFLVVAGITMGVQYVGRSL